MQSVSLPQRAWYYAKHSAAFSGAGILQRMLRRATVGGAEPSRATLRTLGQRFRTLLAQDLANVDAGYYPKSERHWDWQTAWRVTEDLPRVLSRRQDNAWRDLTVPDDGFVYPPYYRRTFHWQSDGYFSHASAERYEASVEFLFGGTAAMMRRQIIPKIVDWARKQPARDSAFSLLDVGTGTGAALYELSRSNAPFRYTGVDLSPAYTQFACERFSTQSSMQIQQANAEQLPFPDASFDVVTSVYMFHELPHKVRRTVLREMVRVLKPGGLVVIEDSAQYSESSAISELLTRFSREFHEPFHTEYLSDALEGVLAEVTTLDSVWPIVVEPCLVAKIVIAERPRA